MGLRRHALLALAVPALLLGLACASSKEPEMELGDFARARQHVYLLEHRYLPALLAEDPARTRDSLEDFGQSFLERCWDQVGERLPEEERVPREGLKVTAHEPQPGLSVFVVTFPKPLGVPENYFSAFCFQGERARYFTLERSFDFGGGPMAVLGEWSSGSHFNYGPGPILDEAGFLARVTELMLEPEEPVAGTTVNSSPEPEGE